MRFALFLCLLATAVAAYQPGKTYNYVFRTQVSSSLLGESPAEIQQQAATGLKAQLKLTFTNDRHAKAQLQHIRMGEMNGRTEKGQQQQIPGELFEKRQIPEELKQKMELPFSVSLVDGVVERINFQEDDSTWAKNIKRAALNMLQLNLKRNDVQALKMESSQPQDEKEQQKLSVFTIPEITLEGVCETTYTIQKRPNGQYEPEQLFNSQEESAQQLSFNVTKNVNFNKCQSTADVSFGFQQNPSQQLQCLKCLRQAETPRQNVGKTEKQEQLKLTQCQQECQTNQLGYEKDIERSTVAHFELHGNTQKYSIRRSKVISQYVVKGQNPAAQNTISQVVAVSELVFKQEEQDETPVPSFKESSQPETLMYSPEWDLEEKRFYMWGDEVFDQKRASPFNKVAQKTEKAIHYLKEIIKQWIQDKEMGYELNSALLFNKLVQIVRQSSTNELKQIQEQLPQSVRSFSENAEEQHRPVEQAKSIFQDALAVAATRNSINLLAEKIKQREISTLKAAELIKVFIANQHSPSDRQADILEKIAVSEPAQNCQVLKQTAWLAHGQAVGRICQKQPAQSQKNQFRVEELCPESKKDLYKKTLLLQWKQAESVYEQILALKVIGNSALENTVEELQKIVTDKRQPTLIRMEAIDALRRMRTSVPEKIQQTLLPVFQDQREQPEIRMAAVSMLLYTQPAPVILDQLVFSVQNDRSQNVKSFVLTALESLSQSPVNAEQQVAKHLKSALKIVKITPEQMRASRKYRVPIYVSEQQNTEEQNLLLGLASIVSPSNLIPVHLSASLRSAFNGDATQEKLQLSFSQKDLEQLYEKVANVFERFNEENLESTEERQSAKDLRQIYSSLGIKSRRTGSYYLSSEESDDESSESAKRSSKLGSNSPFGMIVIRTNDVDQVIIPIDEQKLPQIIRKFVNGEKPSFASQFGEWRDQIALGKRFHQHVALNLGETKVKLPTTAGLPLAIICQTSAVGSVEGKVKVEIESSRRASGHLEIRTSGIATHLHKTEVWSPIVVSGVKTLRTVEINHAPMKLSVQVGEDQIKIVVQPPKQQQKERVLGIHTLPATYTQKFQWESRDYAEPRLMTIRNFALEHTRQEYHLEEQRNRAVRIEGDIHRVKSAKQLLHALYTTENNLHVFYNPTERTPEELILRISGFSFRPTGQNEHQKPEFNDFFSESKSSQRKSFRSIYDDSEEQDYKQIEMHGNEERQSRLSSFVEKYQTGKAFNHQLKLQFEARTPSKSHTAELQVQARCDQWLQHCTSTLNVARSPVGEETSEWQLQAKLQTVAPENVRNSEEPDQKHSRMLVKAEAEWGPSNMQSNRVEIRLQGEPTRKTYWRSDASDKWSRFLNKFDLVADYKLHSAQRHVVQRAFELLKAQYFWQLSTDSTRQGEPNTVRATLVIDPITRRHANLTVQTPEERVRGQMIELPIKIQGYSLERRQNKYQSFGQLVQSYTQQGSAECRADDRRVRTFDGVAYRAPMSECWTVLAKDCSRENPRFVVLMKKTEEEKRVKIITQENTIELQKQPNRFIVKIDGQQVTDEEKLSEFGVEKSSFQVEVSQRGIHVRFDGNMATIKVGGLYKNIQCGLCGHYSEEEEDVFRTSDNKRSQNLKEFHQSYTLKNQECEEQKLNKFYQERGSEEFQIKQRKPQPSFRQGSYYDDSEDSFERQENQWWSSSEEDKENKQKNNPVDQTKVLEYEHKICFSSKPVKRCPSGTTQDENSEPKQVKVQFFCLNRSSTEARHLARQVRNGQIVDPAGHQLSFFDTVEQPTKCQSSDFY